MLDNFPYVFVCFSFAWTEITIRALKAGRTVMSLFLMHYCNEIMKSLHAKPLSLVEEMLQN